MRSLSLVMSMSQHWSDLEQTEYDPQEFVERLAYRARTGSGQGLSDAENLHDVFLAAIKDLKFMHERQTTKCKELEEKVNRPSCHLLFNSRRSYRCPQSDTINNIFISFMFTIILTRFVRTRRRIGRAWLDLLRVIRRPQLLTRASTRESTWWRGK